MIVCISRYSFSSNWNRFKRFHSLCLCSEECLIKSFYINQWTLYTENLSNFDIKNDRFINNLDRKMIEFFFENSRVRDIYKSIPIWWSQAGFHQDHSKTIHHQHKAVKEMLLCASYCSKMQAFFETYARFYFNIDSSRQ